MNRFQITADIDVALLLGTLTEHQYCQNNIEYANLEDFLNVSTEDVRGIVGGALDRALDAVYQSSDYLSACDAVCLDVQEIGN